MAGFGAFMAFPLLVVMIDCAGKGAKFHLMLFGLIPIGKWMHLSGEENMKVELYSRNYSTYSRANIPLDIKRADCRVFVLHLSGKFRVPLQKLKTKQEAVATSNDFAAKLRLVII